MNKDYGIKNGNGIILVIIMDFFGLQNNFDK